MTRSGEVAFPADSRESGTFKGLTKLEYMAAMMMQAMIASSAQSPKACAQEAVKMAEALIEVLNDV
jgi:hypothetical protein